MCTTKEWSTGISAGYVSESPSHCLADSSLGLKANILIANGRGYLTGFSKLTMASDPSPITPPATADGTIRWMSPELFDPDRFNLKENRPTKESDCYALGMVIYEVLSGQAPYAPYNQLVAFQKIQAGECPQRPQGSQGAWFTDGIWGMLELCWKAQPGDRPSLKTILRCLQDVPRPEPPEVDSRSATIANDPSMPSPFLPRLSSYHPYCV